MHSSLIRREDRFIAGKLVQRATLYRRLILERQFQFIIKKKAK